MTKAASILVFAFFGIACILGFYIQQSPSFLRQAAQDAKQTMRYWCPKLDYADSIPGNCPLHNLALIKEGNYYCTIHENEISDKPGKCMICGRILTKMEGHASIQQEVKEPETMHEEKK